MADQAPNRSCDGHERQRLQGYERELLRLLSKGTAKSFIKASVSAWYCTRRSSRCLLVCCFLRPRCPLGRDGAWCSSSTPACKSALSRGSSSASWVGASAVCACAL